MYKRVDVDSAPTRGFGYENQDGKMEGVVALHPGCVKLDMAGMSDRVYTEDIPNLIKSLQAIYDQLKEV